MGIDLGLAGTPPLQLGLIGLILAAKVALPILIVWFPMGAGWANFFLDAVDGDLLIPLGLADANYQPIDKVTDWLTYVAIVVLAYRTAWPIRRLVLGLFVFRSIGQIGFLVSGEELFLAAFPNFLEPLFLVAVTIQGFQRIVRRTAEWRARAFEILARHRWSIGIVLVAYKLQDEYFTHVANIDRTEFIRRLLGW